MRGYFRRRGPDFLILGAMKSGTTSLHAYLAQHPRIQPATKKELYYYDKKIYGDWTLDDYLRQFPRRGRMMLSFDASPGYLRNPHAPRRIAQDFPDAKLIVALRNPVERTYSHYHQEQLKGKERRAFLDAICNEEQLVSADWAMMCADETYAGGVGRSIAYLSRGRYAEQLSTWFDYFPRQQFHVMFTDDLEMDANGVVSKILEFLDLPPYRMIDTSFRRKQRVYPPMPAEARSWLETYFEEPNKRLAELLGRPLPPGWS